MADDSWSTGVGVVDVVVGDEYTEEDVSEEIRASERMLPWKNELRPRLDRKRSR